MELSDRIQNNIDFVTEHLGIGKSFDIIGKEFLIGSKRAYLIMLDGFVETIIFNTALVRRRIKDPNLRFELKSVGRRSKTNVAVGYISDLADSDYIKEIHEKFLRCTPQIHYPLLWGLLVGLC